MNESLCRSMVKERANGLCEKCGNRGSDMHHRKNRSQGGQWCPTNIVLLCRDCHHKITVNPGLAEEDGWTVKRCDEPADIPVVASTMYNPLPQTVYLTADGGFSFSFVSQSQSS